MTPIPVMPYSLIYGERTLRSVANATYQDGVEFLKLAEEIGIQSTVVSYPLEDANRGLLDLKRSKISGEACCRWAVNRISRIQIILINWIIITLLLFG